MTINLKKILGLVGSILLFVGLFMPILSVPLIGPMNFMTGGNKWGITLLVLAISSVFLTALGRYILLLTASIASLAVLIGTFIQTVLKVSTPDSKGTSEVYKSLAEGIAASIQIQWGWAVLFIGAFSLTASAILVSNADGKVVLDKGLFRSCYGKMVSFKKWAMATSKRKWSVIGCTMVICCLAIGGVVRYYHGPCSLMTEFVSAKNDDGTTTNWCRVESKNGLIVNHGPWREYYEDGQMKTEGNFNNGKKEGRWTEYFKSGTKEFEANYSDGILNGTMMKWYDNGQIAQQVTARDGLYVERSRFAAEAAL